MTLLQKLFGTKNELVQIMPEEKIPTSIDLLNKLANAYDKRMIAMIEQIQIIPPGVNEGFFPNTIETTNYYQNIINEFEEIKNNVPKNKGIFIIDGSLESKKEKQFEFHHHPILLSHKMKVQPQIKDFLNPNWHINDISIIKDDLEHIENSTHISTNNDSAWFGSGTNYVPSSNAQQKIIQVGPKGTKEKLLQMYSLLRIKHLNDQGISPQYITNKEFQETIMKQFEMHQQTPNNTYVGDLSCYSLGTDKKTIMEKDDAYYEGKNIFILYDILDALKGF